MSRHTAPRKPERLAERLHGRVVGTEGRARFTVHGKPEFAERLGDFLREALGAPAASAPSPDIHEKG